MRRVIAVLLVGMSGVLLNSIPALAAHHDPGRRNESVTNWGQRDTAVYVVSTLNLLHMRGGRPVVPMLDHRLSVTHFDVFADQSEPGMYFINLKRDDGSVAGSFVYQMGWAKPQLLKIDLTRQVAHRASASIRQEFHTDPKMLIGIFNSTLPA